MIFEQRSKGSAGMSCVAHWRSNVVRNGIARANVWPVPGTSERPVWLEAENAESWEPLEAFWPLL